MHVLKFFLGVVAAVVGLVIAAKLLAILFGLLGVVLKLVWLAVVLGAICLVGWVIYKIFVPNHAEHA